MKVGNLEELDARELIATGSGTKLSVARSLSGFSGTDALLVHHETILPGRCASTPRYHSTKEEIFLVLEGTPSVWIDGELLELKPGDLVGFSAKAQHAHMLLNRSEEAATVLTIGTNSADDQITYVELEGGLF